MKKIYVETLGCQMNKADSEKILGLLEIVGYTETDRQKEADMLLINTCSIRGQAEDKAYSYLGYWGKLKRTRPGLKIAVCGCMGQQMQDEIVKRAPYVDLVFGTHNIDEAPFLVKEMEEKEEKIIRIRKTPFEIPEEYVQIYPKRSSQSYAWINVIEGCDYFCTYCVVPYTRGRQRSRKPQDIVEEAKFLGQNGYQEIILLGQTVDSYGKDLEDGTTLAKLLEQLNDVDGLRRIRFLTSHPCECTDDLIDAVAGLDKVCEYFHIPIQSGSNSVLKRMKRLYTVEEYEAVVEKIRSKVKKPAITSDIIVGFPGETEENFQETVEAVKRIQFDANNTAMYSPRKQTPAAVWQDQLAHEVKQERINMLNKVVAESAYCMNQTYVNSIQQVLVEGCTNKNGQELLTGRTRTNKLVHFTGSQDYIDSVIDVKIVEAGSWSLKGQLN